MNERHGRPIVALTIARALKYFPDADIRIIAPAFDAGGRLDDIPAMFPDATMSVLYAHDASPLDRMIEALAAEPDETHFIRIDGLHFAWLPQHAEAMLSMARDKQFDCVKMPDDFPIQLTADVYRLGALKTVSTLLTQEAQAGIFRVHPKFYMLHHPERFSATRYTDFTPVDDDWLKQSRNIAHDVYIEGRMQVGASQAISAGDQLTLHYELALPYLTPTMHVLDCACGPGYGATILAKHAQHVTAADLDVETIHKAQQTHRASNITFTTADASALTFPDAYVDAITSFETAEHVDPIPYLQQMHRVLRPGGYFFLSTPQNSLGHISVNCQHQREYSLREITDLVSPFFQIEQIVGIKQGRIIFPNDPKGQNTFLVCRK